MAILVNINIVRAQIKKNIVPLFNITKTLMLITVMFVLSKKHKMSN